MSMPMATDTYPSFGFLASTDQIRLTNKTAKPSQQSDVYP